MPIYCEEIDYISPLFLCIFFLVIYLGSMYMILSYFMYGFWALEFVLNSRLYQESVSCKIVQTLFLGL